MHTQTTVRRRGHPAVYDSTLPGDLIVSHHVTVTVNNFAWVVREQNIAEQ